MKTKIITHGGVFHADDAMATAIALAAGNGGLSSFKLETDIKERVTRTRDRDVLEHGIKDHDTILVDVGGCLDPEEGMYDHHFTRKDEEGNIISFPAGVRENGIPYAAAGLLWKFYGFAAISTELQDVPPTMELLSAVISKVDAEVIQAIDAADVGHEAHAGGLSLSRIVAQMNPTWLEVDKEFDEGFIEAVKLCMDVLRNSVWSAVAEELAKEKVEEAVAKIDGGIVQLEEFCPWMEYLPTLEDGEDVLMVIFPSEAGTWMAQGVPVAPRSFETRCSHPEAVRGLRDEALAEATGVEDAVFVHPGGFIGGAKSKEGALALARAAIKAAK